ncbi:MAG TPA: endolytic transglycosylase MltG [Lacisediminihabitans sp.]|uniref:endolytic transglycosylase MltG n=1 Tax=Lacisediminihabitans sp. TaxID=2787631 RepID=UPI002ED93FED
MADDPSWDEIFDSQPPQGDVPRGQAAPTSRRELRERQGTRPRRVDDHGLPPRRPRRRLTWLWVLLTILVLLAGGATAVWLTFEPQIRHVLGWEEPIDYTGQGTGKVVITIKNGQIGGDVAKTLASAGVTKTSEAFYQLLLKHPSVAFEPGSYSLKKQMSAQAALSALQDPKNKVLTRVLLPEGITLKGVVTALADLSQSTGVSREQIQAAVDDYTSYGLPAEAPSLEGYLFPATYTLDPGMSAHDIINTFVQTMFAHLDADGVAPTDRHRILTLASITQKEGGSTADFYKVARVWDNRLAQGINLQSDATVSYGAGGTTISTTDAERADKSNPYNTYANPGLPVGPISNPGDAAITATLHPADGPWLYFVLVNGQTGETKFSTTLAEHNAAVKEWQAWLKAHPGFDG